MTKMWHKDKQQDVDVYDIDYKEKTATCFCAALCQQQSGNGWFTTKLGKLIPYPYAENYKTGMSKTQRNKIKSMLTLVEAVWMTTDGMKFSHADLESAIRHQTLLMGNQE